jgi:hypothetical protein
MPSPAPLAENLPFAFRGERVEPARQLSPADARRLLRARNPTGKPNADVLRERIGVDRAGREQRFWTVDCPPTLTADEVALYAEPAAFLQRAQLTPASSHRDDALRAALARVERFLAAPADGSAGFAWIEGDVVPDDSLLVWARDDDFGAGLLAASAFEAWLDHCHGDVFAALRSFPFPWPPATPLSSLTRAQEDHYFAIARAARAEDPEAIDHAVSQAYGWDALKESAALDSAAARAIVDRLAALHAERK